VVLYSLLHLAELHVALRQLAIDQEAETLKIYLKQVGQFGGLDPQVVDLKFYTYY
jgi:hypothetical protein